MEKILVPKRMMKCSDSEFVAIIGAAISTGSKIFTYDEYISFTVLGASLSLSGKDPPKPLLRTVRSGVLKLKQAGIIDEIAKGYYVFKRYEDDDNQFTLIPVDAIRKIVSSEISEVRSISLLHYFGLFLDTFDNKKNICYMPISYISQRAGKSVQTVIKYNKALKELGLIGVISTVGNNEKTGGVTKHNVYYLSGYIENAKKYLLSRRAKK